MSFQPQPSKPNFREIQQQIIKKRKENKTFEESIESKDPHDPYRFYDGPPFVTGTPHYGTLLSSVCKDVIPRYQTMKGHRVERVRGWDCHGIYIEQKVQKKLGLESSLEIEKFGVKKFVEACYEYTKSTSDERDRYIDNIGRRVDMEHAYKTQDNDYMESVMRVFKQLRDKGLIYKGKRVSMYSTKLSTPISNFEVAMDDTYEEVNDPAITVMYDLGANNENYKNTYILIRTTTPWTIPANMAVGLHKDISYTMVHYEDKNYIVATKRIKDVFKGKDYDIVRNFLGEELVGLSYKPPYDYFYGKTGNDADHKIYHADFATDENGTGIVHEAPEFGEVDFQLAQKEHITISEAMNDEGKYTAQMGDKEGMFYRDANDLVCQELAAKGVLFDKGSVTHRIAFCPRSGTPLVYKAQDSRFVDIQSLKEKLLTKNQDINRFPSHFKNGRFAKSIEMAPDRCISRTRYRGSPMPVWTDGETMNVIGSREELYQQNIGYLFNEKDTGTFQQNKGKGLTRRILIRHGETGIEEYGEEKNMSKEQYSLGNISINEQGKQQTETITKDMSLLVINPNDETVFILSPLRRVAETIAPYFQKTFGYDILNDTKYQEIFDKYQQLRKEDKLATSTQRAKHIYQLKDNIYIDFRITQYAKDTIKEGEKTSKGFISRKERIEEIKTFVDQHNDIHQGKNIVVVSHGAVLHNIRKYHNGGKQVSKQGRGTIKSLYYDKSQPYQVLTKIIFIRHGRTDYNDKHLADGAGKAQLSHLGKQQAQFIANKYKNEKISAIYSSPLQRCQDMVKPLAQIIDKDIITDNRIIEHQSPALQDQPFNCATIKRNDEAIDGQDGESIKDVYHRVKVFLEEIIYKHAGQTVVVCSHGDPLVLMRKVLKDFDYNKEKYKNYSDNKEGADPSFVSYIMQYESEIKELDLHKPRIDTFKIKNKKGKTLTRLSEVLDPWMDSASMPYAQVHYPFENKAKCEASFPADYIAEYTGQIRAWFYVMHVLGVALFDKPAYTNVICTGVMNGNDGRKMSKSYGNYPDPKASFEQFGGDAIRMAMIDSPVVYGGDVAIKEELFLEKTKNILLPLRNAFYFFVTYANIDKWKPIKNIRSRIIEANTDKNQHFLDRWIISELQQVTQQVDEYLSLYNMQKASQQIVGFLDNLTNWYIRRSRRRFWKSENDGDKNTAYETLYFVLSVIAKLCAPFIPFLSEYIYGQLRGFIDTKRSVHLRPFATSNHQLIDQILSDSMHIVQKIVSLGLSRRSKHNIRVRQPLSSVIIGHKLDQKFVDIIADELNVKKVIFDEHINTAAIKIIKPDGRKVGKKFGKDFKQLLSLAKSGTFTELSNGEMKVGEWVLEANEYEIDYIKTSEEVEAHDGIVIKIDPTITPSLQREGYARDLVRHIQETRKEAGYNIADRILLHISADNIGIVDNFSEYIQEETLSQLTDSMLSPDITKEITLDENITLIVSLKK